MKAAYPNGRVLVGGLFLDCNPDNPPVGTATCPEGMFLRGILASGSGSFFDGVSFHAYDYYYGKGIYGNANWYSSSSTTGPVSIGKANYIKSVLAQKGYSEKYLMNTETAVFWGPYKLAVCDALEEEKPSIELTKVNYVIHSYAVAVAEGWRVNVWYSAFGVRCSGLLNPDLSPKAGYYAYQFARQKFNGAVFVREISEYDGVMGYEYEAPGRRLWVVWSLDGQPHNVILPGVPIEVNMIGEDGVAGREANNLTLTIDLSPRFVEFGR